MKFTVTSNRLHHIALLLATIAIFISAVNSHAQADSDSLQISFVVFYPGSDIYELEGHAALRIKQGDMDYALSYGTFDFDAPNFVYRFVKGETDYWVTAPPFPLFYELYARQGRRIVEHPLLLDSVQQQRLLEIASRNLLPQNSTYRYNYVKDNCSLRPLRVVQAAVGDSIILGNATGFTSEAKSFRDVMRLCHANYPWYQFGIDLALGSGIDYPIDNYERAFAPITLDTQLPQSTVNEHPLTSAPIVLNEGRDVRLSPTPWFLTPLAVSYLLLLISIGITIHDVRHHKVTRWFDAILFSLYGLAGLLLTFLIFISVHEATSPNWLYLWLNPLCLIVPIFIWLKNCKYVVFSYQIANFALIFVLCVSWPFTGQSGNPAFVPLIACDALRAISYIYVTLYNRKISA